MASAALAGASGFVRRNSIVYGFSAVPSIDEEPLEDGVFCDLLDAALAARAGDFNVPVGRGCGFGVLERFEDIVLQSFVYTIEQARQVTSLLFTARRHQSE